MHMNTLKSKLRVVDNFPIPGIKFRDVTSWFEDPSALHEIRNSLRESFRLEDVDKVVAIESRGFVGGALLADSVQAGLVLARKAGKLPTKTISLSYEKEYGIDTLEIGVDAIKEGDVVVIHDDLLATGGTAMAVWNLVQQFKPSKVIFSFLIEITDEGLGGRKLLEMTGCEVRSVLTV